MEIKRCKRQGKTGACRANNRIGIAFTITTLTDFDLRLVSRSSTLILHQNGAYLNNMVFFAWLWVGFRFRYRVPQSCFWAFSRIVRSLPPQSCSWGFLSCRSLLWWGIAQPTKADILYLPQNHQPKIMLDKRYLLKSKQVHFLERNLYLYPFILAGSCETPG